MVSGLVVVNDCLFVFKVYGDILILIFQIIRKICISWVIRFRQVDVMSENIKISERFIYIFIYLFIYIYLYLFIYFYNSPL